MIFLEIVRYNHRSKNLVFMSSIVLSKYVFKIETESWTKYIGYTSEKKNLNWICTIKIGVGYAICAFNM